MSEKVYSYGMKINNEIGTIDIYNNQLTINTNNINRTISYDNIHSLYLSEINSKDFEIETDTGEIIHIVIIENDARPFTEAYKYIDSCIKQQSTNQTREDNVEILLAISAQVTENKNLLHLLSQQTQLKRDINYIQTINITEYSSFTVYDDHISIDNIVYSQNIPYNMIANVMLKENNSLFEKLDQNNIMTTVEIILQNNSNIVLSFRQMEKNTAFQVYNLILPKVQTYTYNSQQNNMNQQYAPNQQNTYQNNNYTNQQYPNGYQPVHDEKSVLIAIILHVLFTGLGYAYVGRWDRFIIVAVSIIVCGFFWFLLLPLLGILVIWIYALIDTIRSVEDYNKGIRF